MARVASMIERNKDGKVCIAVLGVTGAGKSTFVTVATGAGDVKIGHGLEPCK